MKGAQPSTWFHPKEDSPPEPLALKMLEKLALSLEKLDAEVLLQQKPLKTAVEKALERWGQRQGGEKWDEGLAEGLGFEGVGEVDVGEKAEDEDAGEVGERKWWHEETTPGETEVGGDEKTTSGETVGENEKTTSGETETSTAEQDEGQHLWKSEAELESGTWFDKATWFFEMVFGL